MLTRFVDNQASYCLAVLFSGMLAACASTRPTPLPITLIDLTYPLDHETVYWPHNAPFTWERTDWGMTAGGYWYASAKFSASEHGGTHMDAPIHFGQGRHTVDQIPVERLVAPAVVLDVRPQCDRNSDYEVTTDDILAWEAKNGRIPPGTIALIHTGWGRHWPDRQRYLGSRTPDDASTLHFPGVSQAAALFLVKDRAVNGLGIDTASIDPGQSRDFPVHRVLGEANVYALENVAALERLPATGATLWALPIKIRGGTGGPVRLIATVP